MAVSVELDRRLKFVLTEASGEAKYQQPDAPGSVGHRGSELRDGRWPRGKWEVGTRAILLLRQLHTTASAEDQRGFLIALRSHLSPENARLAAHLFVELGDFDTLFYWETFDEIARSFWEGVADKVGIEPWLFTDEDLERVSGGIDRIESLATSVDNNGHRLAKYPVAVGMMSTIPSVRRIVNRVRVDRIEESFSAGVNPAIDSDRRQLLSRIQALGFSDRLNAALLEIERRGTSAASEFDFKAAMDLLRTFYEEFMEEAAKKIQPRVGTAAPESGAKGVNHFASFKDYLKNAGVFNTDEDEVLRRLYAYLSNQGSHKLGAAPEQFHVAKVTVIEWCMMLAGRVQRYLA